MKRLKLFLQICLFVTLGVGCNNSRDEETDKQRIKSRTVLTKIYPLWFSEGDKEPISERDTLYLKNYEEYDALGNLTVEKVRSGDVNQDTYYKYKYNLDGQIIERWQSSRPDFSRSSLATYLYDENGRLAKQTYRDIGGNFRSTTTYSYNKLGTLQYIRYGNDNWLKHDYDKQNNLVKKSHNYYFVNYTYNDKNQLVQETLFYNSPDTVSTTWFYYDKKGYKVQEIKKQFDSSEADTVNLIYNDVTNLVAYSVQGLDTLILRYEFY